MNKLLYYLFFSLLLTGCAKDFKLVSYGSGLGFIPKWHAFSPPKAPGDATEIAVVQVSDTEQPVSLDNSDVMFLHQYNDARYVAVVERATADVGTTDDERFLEKNVTNYKVVAGKLAAKSEPVPVFFHTIGFERAVIAVAKRAKSLDPILMYDDGISPVAMTSRKVSDCISEVYVYERDYVRGQPIASKTVVFCQ